jgi:hypothetical protein
MEPALVMRRMARLFTKVSPEANGYSRRILLARLNTVQQLHNNSQFIPASEMGRVVYKGQTYAFNR